MTDQTSSLRVLGEAKVHRTPWIQVADALLALEATSDRAPNGTTWISYAADVSGMSDNQLRRFTRARAFVQEIEAKDRRLGERLRELPFAHVEVFAKISQLDKARSLQLIEQASANRFTYLELLEDYRTLRSKGLGQASPMAAGKHAAQEFISACLRILLKTQLLTAGVHYPKNQRTILRPVVSFGYTNPNFVVRDDSAAPSQPTIDAIDCYFVSGRAQSDALKRKISQMAFESTFFTGFWCLMPSSELVANFISARTELKLHNVGLAIVDVANESCSSILAPKSLPQPDRRDILLSSYGYKRLRSVTK